MVVIIGIVCLFFSIQVNGIFRPCTNTGALLSNAILNSPIIVYGFSKQKRIYLQTDTEVLFNVTLHVECVFKGSIVENEIKITEAGIKADRSACQMLEPGTEYVVFLEKCKTTHANHYCPLDYNERPGNDNTFRLLEKVCGLKLMTPLNSITNNCPNVSIGAHCSNDNISTKTAVHKKTSDDLTTHMKLSFNDSNQFYFQSNETKVKVRSTTNLIADSPRNCASVFSLTSVSIVYLIVNVIKFIF